MVLYILAAVCDSKTIVDLYLLCMNLCNPPLFHAAGWKVIHVPDTLSPVHHVYVNDDTKGYVFVAPSDTQTGTVRIHASVKSRNMQTSDIPLCFPQNVTWTVELHRTASDCVVAHVSNTQVVAYLTYDFALVAHDGRCLFKGADFKSQMGTVSEKDLTAMETWGRAFFDAVQLFLESNSEGSGRDTHNDITPLVHQIQGKATCVANALHVFITRASWSTLRQKKMAMKPENVVQELAFVQELFDIIQSRQAEDVAALCNDTTSAYTWPGDYVERTNMLLKTLGSTELSQACPTSWADLCFVLTFAACYPDMASTKALEHCMVAYALSLYDNTEYRLWRPQLNSFYEGCLRVTQSGKNELYQLRSTNRLDWSEHVQCLFDEKTHAFQIEVTRQIKEGQDEVKAYCEDLVSEVQHVADRAFKTSRDLYAIVDALSESTSLTTKSSERCATPRVKRATNKKTPQKKTSWMASWFP